MAKKLSIFKIDLKKGAVKSLVRSVRSLTKQGDQSKHLGSSVEGRIKNKTGIYSTC